MDKDIQETCADIWGASTLHEDGTLFDNGSELALDENTNLFVKLAKARSVT